MQFVSSRVRLSATDLSHHLGCRHLTTLELVLARGERGAPWTPADPRLEVLRRRGLEHEQAFLAHLRSQALRVEEIPRSTLDEEERRTHEAMVRGVDVIAQGVLAAERWNGRPDVLRRVERPSRLGPWSYEPYDTKLAVRTRGGTVLQLCLYAALLDVVQGEPPEWMHAVTPATGLVPESYRVAEYRAYYSRVRRSLETSVGTTEGPVATYPLPCEHCDVCRWAMECEARWREDDHLCLVAGMRRAAERELGALDVTTLARLAAWAPAEDWRPIRGARRSFLTLHDQARLQLASRGAAVPVYEWLSPTAEQGLARLPEPAPGDLFLDLEGDAFFAEGGLEYLFGLAGVDSSGSVSYTAWWALDRRRERAAFEALMDHLIASWRRDAALHVYHYGHYDPAALKRLASRHGSREEELDELLRAERFVDLHQVVRQGLRAGVEGYSIKRLEPLYGFEREAPLREAGRVRAELEAALDLGCGEAVTAADRDLVERYNRDDCLSARELRGWLEAGRAALVASGTAIPRPVATETGEASEGVNERLTRIRALAERLLAGVPAEPSERSSEQQGRWLLGHLLEFNRREERVVWWEFFRLAALDDEQRREERCAIAGLVHVGRRPPEGRRKVPIDRYSFPFQEVDGRYSNAHVSKEQALGTVEQLDLAAGWVDVRKRRDAAELHPTSLFLHGHVDTKVKESSLLRLGAWVADHGVDAAGPRRAARDLLLGITARGCTCGSDGLRRPDEPLLVAALRLAAELREGVLPVQGPPGAGKTFTGARMIVELVRQGKRIGITALSHKVIRNLLDEVTRAAMAAVPPVTLRCVVKVEDAGPGSAGGVIDEVETNEEVLAALAAGTHLVAAGTAWVWSRPEMEGALEVLFVDEAGQMALADALAVAPAARSLVLLGDPQQLEQPVQGAHPEGCEVAALQHLLESDAAAVGGRGTATLAPHRGLFLEDTWRLHPTLCAFTSEQFYEGRLRSRPGLERQTLHAAPLAAGAGLFYLPISHEGCQNASVEEAEAIASLLTGWRDVGAAWTDKEGEHKPLRLEEDVLIVAPYNAQLALLRRTFEAVGLGPARIGTVDKFQGQEAPVVIYSMTTSSPEEAPRGMEFLYSRNRLNVATSRARCACVLVASPRLLEPDCRTPRQMRLANALCAYVEGATLAPWPVALLRR